MITLLFTKPTFMIQFFIILGSLSHKNPPLNINLPTIFIFLISYNITFNPSHVGKINYRVSMLQVLYNSAQRKAHAFRPTLWKDDMIFKVNINNSKKGCTFIISPLIAKRPKAFQQNRILPWDRF